jgi:2-C-methyl-D-erythritol 4-phosphate cytidylyltransferase
MIVSAIIPVAGRGKRFGGQLPKQYLELNGQPVINLTLRPFVSLPAIHGGVVVAAREEMERISAFLGNIEGFAEKFRVIEGGKERQDSVYSGLQQIPSDTNIVIVHDGVRPFVSHSLLLRSIDTAQQFGACIVAVPVKETIKKVDKDQVIETIPRESLWQAQTPQTFRYSILKKAHDDAHRLGFCSTDESALVEWAGFPVRIVMGDYRNIKITTREDLKIAGILAEEVRD